MVGYGVDPHAPIFPFVVPTLLFRPFRWLWQPVLGFLAWCFGALLSPLGSGSSSAATKRHGLHFEYSYVGTKQNGVGNGKGRGVGEAVGMGGNGMLHRREDWDSRRRERTEYGTSWSEKVETAKVWPAKGQWADGDGESMMDDEYV